MNSKLFSSCNNEICHCNSMKLLLFLDRIWKSARLCIFHIKRAGPVHANRPLYSEYAIIVASFGDTIKRNVSTTLYHFIHTYIPLPFPTVTFATCSREIILCWNRQDVGLHI